MIEVGRGGERKDEKKGGEERNTGRQGERRMLNNGTSQKLDLFIKRPFETGGGRKEDWSVCTYH